MYTVLTSYQQLEQLFKLLGAEFDRVCPKNAAFGTSDPIDALLDGGFVCYMFDLETAVLIVRVPDTRALIVEIDQVGDLPDSVQALLNRFISRERNP